MLFSAYHFSGLGYVIGSGLATAFADWKYSMRGTPLMLIIAVLMVIFVLVDPPRGQVEGKQNFKSSSYLEDVKSLVRVKSYVSTTLAYSCVTFSVGAMAWWTPKLLETGIRASEIPEEEREMTTERSANRCSHICVKGLRIIHI